MRRNVSLEEISDGKLYGLNDMVKADCQDCKGCCDCCTGMGDSVILESSGCTQTFSESWENSGKAYGKRAGAWSVRQEIFCRTFLWKEKRRSVCF